MPLSRLPYRTILPSLEGSQIQQESQQSLLSGAATIAEGATKTPDGKTFASTILDRSLHGADAQNYLGIINNLANDYLTKYSKDPYYAFTQKGKRQIQQMQQIVNDPAFERMENIKKQNDKEYERVAAKGLQTSLMVNDFGGIAVFDNETRSRRFINPEDFDENKHYALTVADDYSLLENYEGASRLAAYDVEDFDTVMKNIQDMLSKVKLNKWNEEYNAVRSLEDIGGQGGVPVNITRERESNAQQMGNMINMIKSNGLSPTAIKTLKSHYFRMNPNELGSEGANQRADKWIIDQINRVANGQRVETNRTSTTKIPGLSGGEGKSGQLDDQLVWNQIMENQWGTNKVRTIDQNGNITFGDGHAIPVEYMQARDNPLKDPDTGLKVPNLSVKDNPWFQVGDKDNIQIGVVNDSETHKSGEYINIPYEMIQDGTIKFDSKPGTITYDYVDAYNNIISPEKYQELKNKLQNNTLSEDEINQYFTVDPETGEGNFRMKQFVDTKIVIPRPVELFGVDPEVKKRNNFLKDAGYDSSETFVDEYMTHSGKRLDSSVFKVDDEAFVVKIRMPLSEGAPGGVTRLFNEGVLTEKDLNMYQNLRTRPLKSINLGKIRPPKSTYRTFGQ